MDEKIFIYDTTLREGTQGEGISFGVEDKISITERLDDLGVSYIEGGWPDSNPQDGEFFDKVKRLKLHNAKLVTFGSVCQVGKSPETYYQESLKAETPSVLIFGNASTLHVTEVLRISVQQNLDIIANSISFLKKNGKEVLFAAEHFFDGFNNDQENALNVLRVAQEAGADWLVLADTNGGILPHELSPIFKTLRQHVTTPISIHCHNDSEVGVANSIEAVKLGARQVQGTVNGLGKRCGNTNLISIIPNLQLKMGYMCIPPENIKKLKNISRFVDEMANRPPWRGQPYVGSSAYAHKGDLGVDDIKKVARFYEHISADTIGNNRRTLDKDLSGRAYIVMKAKDLGIELKHSEIPSHIVSIVKDLESKGYDFEGADASFELLLRKSIEGYNPFFNLKKFYFSDQKRTSYEIPHAVATVGIEIKGKEEESTAEGVGPLVAMIKALRKVLDRAYPILKDVRIMDFKMRILLPRDSDIMGPSQTNIVVRVLLSLSDSKMHWTTLGVSENIIDASWQALLDAFEYKLIKSH